MKSLKNNKLLSIDNLLSFELTFISEREYLADGAADFHGWVLKKINNIQIPFHNQNWFFHLKGIHNKDYISDLLFESKIKQSDLEIFFNTIHKEEIPKLNLRQFSPNLDNTNIYFYRNGNIFDFKLCNK